MSLFLLASLLYLFLYCNQSPTLTTNTTALRLDLYCDFSLRRNLSIKTEAVVRPGAGAGDTMDIFAALSVDYLRVGVRSGGCDRRGDEEGKDCCKDLHVDGWSELFEMDTDECEISHSDRADMICMIERRKKRLTMKKKRTVTEIDNWDCFRMWILRFSFNSCCGELGEFGGSINPLYIPFSLP